MDGPLAWQFCPLKFELKQLTCDIPPFKSLP
jgi:hypothetical protein